MTIWIFGDSYSREHGVEWQWFKQLSKLTGQDVQVCGQGGWSNSYISYLVDQQISNGSIKPDDFVIQIQTQHNRYWFFEDRPELGNWNGHADARKIGMSNKEYEAWETFIKYLYNPKESVWQTYANSMALVGMTHTIPCRCITLPAFWNEREPYNPHLAVIGTLTEWVSYLEFDTEEEWRAAISQPGGDPRPNHLSEHNHGVLAQKIADAVLENKDINLMEGFDIRKPRREEFLTDHAYEEWCVANAD